LKIKHFSIFMSDIFTEFDRYFSMVEIGYQHDSI